MILKDSNAEDFIIWIEKFTKQLSEKINEKDNTIDYKVKKFKKIYFRNIINICLGFAEFQWENNILYIKELDFTTTPQSQVNDILITINKKNDGKLIIILIKIAGFVYDIQYSYEPIPSLILYGRVNIESTIKPKLDLFRITKNSTHVIHSYIHEDEVFKFQKGCIKVIPVSSLQPLWDFAIDINYRNNRNNNLNCHEFLKVLQCLAKIEKLYQNNITCLNKRFLNQLEIKSLFYAFNLIKDELQIGIEKYITYIIEHDNEYYNGAIKHSINQNNTFLDIMPKEIHNIIKLIQQINQYNNNYIRKFIQLSINNHNTHEHLERQIFAFIITSNIDPSKVWFSLLYQNRNYRIFKQLYYNWDTGYRHLDSDIIYSREIYNIIPNALFPLYSNGLKNQLILCNNKEFNIFPILTEFGNEIDFRMINRALILRMIILLSKLKSMDYWNLFNLQLDVNQSISNVINKNKRKSNTIIPAILLEYSLFMSIQNKKWNYKTNKILNINIDPFIIERNRLIMEYLYGPYIIEELLKCV